MKGSRMTPTEIEEHKAIAAANVLFFRAVGEAKVSCADEIFAIEKVVNGSLGGDADIAELVAIMIARGWTRPSGDA